MQSRRIFVLVRCLELFSRNVGMTGHLFWPMWRARIVHLADKNAYAVTEGGVSCFSLPRKEPGYEASARLARVAVFNTHAQ